MLSYTYSDFIVTFRIIILYSTTCDNYFLFDKLTDKSDKKGKKEKDKRITLGDMCPKECHKNVCKP